MAVGLGGAVITIARLGHFAATHSVRAGVMGSVVGGVIAGLFAAWAATRWGPQWPTDSSTVRKAAVKAVRRGEAISDPVLAPCVVTVAEHVLRRQSSRLRRSDRVILPAMVALYGLGFFIEGVMEGDVGNMAGGGRSARFATACDGPSPTDPA